MKYLDSTRSEKSKKLLKIFNILFRILFWVVIASEIIKYIMLVTSEYFTFGGFLLFIFSLILYTVVFAFGIWAFNIFWNAFIALVESAEHTIAHIQEMHKDGKFIQQNNNPSQTNNNPSQTNNDNPNWLTNEDRIKIEELKTLKGHSDSVFSVCFSPDGKYLASCSRDKTVIIWDANSGEKLKTLKGHSYEVNSVAYSPDGKKIISGSRDETIKIWGIK